MTIDLLRLGCCAMAGRGGQGWRVLGSTMSAMDEGRAAALARRLMDEHGLQRWGFAFDRAKRRAGACHHHTRRITLSAALTALHDEAQVRDTILHEIAHALVGPQHGHDEVWRRTAIQIGSSGERTFDTDGVTVPGRWQGRCQAGHEIQRYRRPTRVLLCTACRGIADVDRVFAWWCDGQAVPEEHLGPHVVAVLEHLRRGHASRPAIRR